MITDWAEPFLLTSPRGVLYLNEEQTFQKGIYVLDPARCEAVGPIRQTRESIPQASGSIMHREYVEGITIKLVGQLMETRDTPACGAFLREMWDTLGLHTNALLCEFPGDEADVGSRRIQWTPADYGQDRILLDVRMLAEPTYGFDGWSGFQFSLHSPYPYAVDSNEASNAISAGGSATLHNPGNCLIWPNVKVFGDTSSFTYTNETLDLSVIYDASLPGAIEITGGNYGFFNHFANSAYKNGDEGNLKAGIDITASDFFPLLPGDNLISATGADIQVIWNAGFRT